MSKTAKNDNTMATVVNSTFYSLEAEQSLLGCALIDNRTVQDILLNLTEEDFYSPANKIIFNSMREIVKSNKALDLVSLIDSLERKVQMANVGGIDYITSLATCVPTAVNFKMYLDIVVRESTKRKLAYACTDILKNIRQADDKTKLLADAEKLIYDIGKDASNGELLSVRNDVQDFIQRCDEIYKNKDAFKGILTGFKRFDKTTNGLQKGDLIVLAARPGCGKSSLALNIVENAAKQGKICAVFSLEMPRSQLVQRLVCGIGSISMGKFSGSERLNSADFSKLLTAADLLSKLKIYIDDSSLNTPAKMMSKCRSLKMKEGLDLIVVDYIQLMQSDETKVENRQQDVSSITRNLKIMAKELNVPIIALSQMNRLFERDKDRKPMLSDLRESGAIEQDADMVLFINKSADAGYDEVLPVELIIAKHRNGETADIPLNFIGKFVHFVDGNNFPAIPPKQRDDKEGDLIKAEFSLDNDSGDEGLSSQEGDYYNMPLPPVPEEENKQPINEEELNF
jgi:replicative DNA helicase